MVDTRSNSIEPSVSGSSILILIIGHFANAPRPQKEAAALVAAGARVTVCGVWSNHRLAEEDVDLAKKIGVDFSPVIDLIDRNWKSFRLRLLQRIASELYQKLGWVTPRAFGTGAPEMLKAAKEHNADLTMVHSEAGLWVGKQLLKDDYRVGVDFEDWFSADLLPEDRKYRPIDAMRQLEQYLLQHASCCMTTSKVLSKAMMQDAKASHAPVVIPNCFPASGREQAISGPRDCRTKGVVSFHWFSQTIGPGRGLETLAKALLLLKGDWQVSLRGAIRGYGQWYKETFSESLRERISLLEPVSNNELLSRTIAHDVGLALEVPYCPSRDLTATNKIFEYFRAGLAVIATRTKGQEEVMQASVGSGILVEPNDTQALASAMQRMIDDPDYLESCRRASTEAGGTVWDWSNHAPRLVNTIAEGLI